MNQLNRYLLSIFLGINTLVHLKAASNETFLHCHIPGPFCGTTKKAKNIKLERADGTTFSTKIDEKGYKLNYENPHAAIGEKGFVKACRAMNGKFYSDNKGNKIDLDGFQSESYRETVLNDELICLRGEKTLTHGDMLTYINYPKAIRNPYKYNNPNNLIVNEILFSKICLNNNGTHYKKKSTGEITPAGKLSLSGIQDLLDTVPQALYREYYQQELESF